MEQMELYIVSNINYLKGKDSYRIFANKTGIPVGSLRGYGYGKRTPVLQNLVKLYIYGLNIGALSSMDELFFKNLSTKLKE